jgi:hypothetical protein
MLLNLLRACSVSEHHLDEVVPVNAALVLRDASILGEKAEIHLRGVPTFLLAMIVGTMCLAALLALGHAALLMPEVVRVVFLLLPAVAASAAVLELAAILVGLSIFFCFPG